MFDFGLDKIASLIVSQSENAINDLISKINPSYHQISDFKTKSMAPTRAPSQIQSKSFTAQKNLKDKKARLLEQLQNVNNQIMKTKIEQSRLQIKKKTEIDNNDIQAFNKATELVARMNHKRKQLSQSNKVKGQKLALRIQSSLKQFKQMEEKQQKQKQQKRHIIEQRIQKRKQKFKIVQQISKKSNALIQQLQGYRTSLPNINKFKNPQQENEFDQSHTKKMKKKILQQYPKSPFLQKIQQQQLNKQRQQYIKSYEKKKIRQRQQTYGRKIRKNLKESTLFVTD